MPDIIGLEETWGNIRAKLNSEYATAEQGVKADSAVQPEDPATVSEVTASTYTVLSTDVNKVRILTDATGVALTLPNNMSQGFLVTVIQGGAGKITFAPASGATMQSADSYTKTRVQFSSALAMVKLNADGVSAQWVIIGDLIDL